MVSELIERLEDDASIFTRNEATELINWYVQLATQADIRSMRETVERDYYAERNRRAEETLRKLEEDKAQRHASIRPNLIKVVPYDQA